MCYWTVNLPTKGCPKPWRNKYFCSWSCAAVSLGKGSTEHAQIEIGTAWLRQKAPPEELSDQQLALKGVQYEAMVAARDRKGAPALNMHQIRTTTQPKKQAVKAKDVPYHFYTQDQNVLMQNPVRGVCKDSDLLSHMMSGRSHVQLDAKDGYVIVSSGPGKDRKNEAASVAVGGDVYGPVLILNTH